jgi:exodeoxyribonuclease-3
MKIATWNINSVRLRENLLLKLLEDENIDIICLQETKTENQFFPTANFKKAGFNHLYFEGEKSYNGVAIISKTPLKNNKRVKIFNDDKRHVSTYVETKNIAFELHNFYIPAGGDIPDVKENPKFNHKLNFVDEAGEYFYKNHKANDNIIILGDFNIAPYEHDVWSHKQLLDVVSHTPIEVEKLSKFRESIDFLDVARKFVPENEKLYSWWSYRNKDWKKSNRGRRLDHIWVTGEIKNKLKKFEILNYTRDWKQTSDHVPVVIEI